jgi:hypothetical protein
LGLVAEDGLPKGADQSLVPEVTNLPWIPLTWAQRENTAGSVRYDLSRLVALAGLHKDIPSLAASSIINLSIHEALNEPAGYLSATDIPDMPLEEKHRQKRQV